MLGETRIGARRGVGDDGSHDPARRRADRERRQDRGEEDRRAASGPPPACSVHAATSAAMLAVKVIAGFQPARGIGMSMARVKSQLGELERDRTEGGLGQGSPAWSGRSATTAARSASRPAVRCGPGPHTQAATVVGERS